jgi:hypothetical protein
MNSSRISPTRRHLLSRLLILMVLVTALATVPVLRVGGENFSLTNVFRALAKDDLYRAVEVAKSFKYEAPRAAVTLAIANSILDKTHKISQD